MSYEWLKALHVISFVAWMAGLFYLPRLFVYHVGQAPGSPASETFKVMERRLLYVIMTPAMLATWVFGLWLAQTQQSWTEGWLHGKLLLVVLLTVFHHLCMRWRRAFAQDRNRRTARFYRIANEVPTLLFIGVVILVIVKPF